MNRMFDNETELTLHIDDDLRLMRDFSVDEDYPDSDNDEMSTVRVIIINGNNETIAYMELFIFYEYKIDMDMVMYADSVTGDAFRAMYALRKNGLLDPPGPDSIEVFDFADEIIVHLHYIAVRDDYRKQGIGEWLLRNLPRILSRNYSISPRLISTSLCPQVIKWDNEDKSKPSFFAPNEDADSPGNKAMYALMKKMFVKNGYHQLGDTEHYYTKPFMS